MKSSLNSEIYATHLRSFTGSFCDIAQPYKLLTSHYLRYDYFLFLSYSFIYLLLDFVYLRVTYFPFNSFFDYIK